MMVEQCSMMEGVGTMVMGKEWGWECEKCGEFGVDFDDIETIFVASGAGNGYYQPVHSNQ